MIAVLGKCCPVRTERVPAGLDFAEEPYVSAFRLMDPMTFHNPYYFIGCPVWNCPHWKGSVYAPKAAKDKWLGQYASLFNTVEGNSTFYGIPAVETFRRWGERAGDGFRFCLKFPRAITHDQMLVGAAAETNAFLDGLFALDRAGRLGPTFLQLGPRFAPHQLEALAAYLKSLPSEFTYAVEVRHLDWFTEPAAAALNQLCREQRVDRVIFDSRPLYSAPPTDPIEAASQTRKPKSPIHHFVTGESPMLRLVGRNDLDTVTPWIEEWVPQVVNWIAEGKRPIVFTHAPDDQFAPEFARRFHNRLVERLVERYGSELPELQPVRQWPHAAPVQRSLF